ncbi:MAG TPA: hypothetical protein VK196_05620 [Magnetospirillum sp.]|nr:hypothetical protein [Magnetospirillum sp.]
MGANPDANLRELVTAESRAVIEANLERDAKEINVRLEKAEKLAGQADDHRLAAAILLAAAKERCQEAKIIFQQWCETNVKQSYETVRKLIPIGVAEGKEKGAGKLLLSDMRAANALRNKEHRARKRSSTSSPTQESISMHPRNSERSDPWKAWLRTAVGNAKRDGRECTVTLSDLPKKIPEKCPVLGISLRLAGPKYDDFAPSFDRIDNSKGYVPGNILVVSRRANRLKADATPEELYKLAEFYSKTSCESLDDSNQARQDEGCHNLDCAPKSILTEFPESTNERGAVTYAILRAYSPDLTVYEVAKLAGMHDRMDDVRRILAYHQKKCISMRERIDLLVERLNGVIR